MYTIRTGLIALALAAVVIAPSAAHAASHDSASKIQALLTQLKSLQEQLQKLRGEIRETVQEGLKEGMSNDDVRKIQELLASDPEVYPFGKATGYFGPLTKDAVKKFQKKAGLAETGVVDSGTRRLMEEMLTERFNGKVPPGLLKAPGIYKKYMDRVHGKSGVCVPPFCKMHHKDKDDDSNDDGELEIDVEFADGDAKIRIDYPNGTRKNLTLENETDEDDVIDYIVDYFDDRNDDFDEDDVRDAIEFDNSNWGKDVESIEVEVSSTTAEATVEYKDGDDEEFDYNETDRDEIVEDLADELGLDEDEIIDLIEWTINISSDVKEITVDFDGDDAEVRIEFDNGYVMEFVYADMDENDEDDIIEMLAEELDMDEDDVEDVTDFNS